MQKWKQAAPAGSAGMTRVCGPPPARNPALATPFDRFPLLPRHRLHFRASARRFAARIGMASRGAWRTGGALPARRPSGAPCPPARRFAARMPPFPLPTAARRRLRARLRRAEPPGGPGGSADEGDPFREPARPSGARSRRRHERPRHPEPPSRAAPAQAPPPWRSCGPAGETLRLARGLPRPRAREGRGPPADRARRSHRTLSSAAGLPSTSIPLLIRAGEASIRILSARLRRGPPQ
jgi:hypothetical protein